MKNRIAIALLLGGLSTPLLPVAPARSQLSGAVVTCAENPGACAWAASAAAYVVWKYGKEWLCPSYVAQCHEKAPRANTAQLNTGNANIPGQIETHFVMSRQLCKAMFDRYKGDGLTSYDFEPNPQPGMRSAGWCKLRGPGARVDRFHDRRYDPDY